MTENSRKLMKKVVHTTSPIYQRPGTNTAEQTFRAQNLDVYTYKTFL